MTVDSNDSDDSWVRGHDQAHQQRKNWEDVGPDPRWEHMRHSFTDTPKLLGILWEGLIPGDYSGKALGLDGSPFI